VLAVLLCTLAGSPIGAAAETTNLISNGNFESVVEGWPKDWGRPKDQTITWEAESGNHYLRLHASQPGQMIMAYREIALPPRPGRSN